MTGADRDRDSRLRIIRAVVKTDAPAAVAFLVCLLGLLLFGDYQCRHRKICLWSNAEKQPPSRIAGR